MDTSLVSNSRPISGPVSEQRHHELLVKFSRVDRWSKWEPSTQGLGPDPHQIDPPDDPGDQDAGFTQPRPA